MTSLTAQCSRAVKVLERSYLLRSGGEIIERPQFMYMRIAVVIHGDDIPRVLETYELLSTGKYSHASPTMWNAGTAWMRLGTGANRWDPQSMLTPVVKPESKTQWCV